VLLAMLSCVRGMQASRTSNINPSFLVQPRQCCAQILEGEGAGLQGRQSALGRYELDGEKGFRQVVYFTAIRIAPEAADADARAKWLSVFRAGNPTMVRAAGPLHAASASAWAAAMHVLMGGHWECMPCMRVHPGRRVVMLHVRMPHVAITCERMACACNRARMAWRW
jgi:hypothetical protein